MARPPFFRGPIHPSHRGEIIFAMWSRKLLACAFFTTLALSATPTVVQGQDPPSHCNPTDPNEIECLTLTVEERFLRRIRILGSCLWFVGSG